MYVYTHVRAHAHTYRFYDTFPSLPFNVQLDPISLSVLRVFQNAICVFLSNMITVIEIIYLLWPIESRILELMSKELVMPFMKISWGRGIKRKP